MFMRLTLDIEQNNYIQKNKILFRQYFKCKNISPNLERYLSAPVKIHIYIWSKEKLDKVIGCNKLNV